MNLHRLIYSHKPFYVLQYIDLRFVIKFYRYFTYTLSTSLLFIHLWTSTFSDLFEVPTILDLLLTKIRTTLLSSPKRYHLFVVFFPVPFLPYQILPRRPVSHPNTTNTRRMGIRHVKCGSVTLTTKSYMGHGILLKTPLTPIYLVTHQGSGNIQ